MENFKQFRDTNYSISNKGRIRNDKTGRILKGTLRPDGYVRHGLMIEGKRTMKYAHRLVAECFLDNYSEELTVNHMNGIKNDNNVENLEMVTQLENNLHAIKELGVGKKRRIRQVEQYTLDGEFVAEYANIAVASRAIERDRSTLRATLMGETNTCAGYKWKFK